MATAFRQVPDWESWDNQGGGIATADLDGDGQPELIVLRVDRPTQGPNVAFYRVGRSLDAQGDVAAWGPWIGVPDWAADQNQGTGLAVADLDGDGRPELIVFQVQQRVPGPNRATFRVGRSLDAVGAVTAGWGAWQDVPDWGSWANPAAAIAVADLDGDGQPELIVLRVDDYHAANSTKPNRAYYRVGQRFVATGQVTGGWGPWMELDCFSWFNQGAGLAVADLDENGRPELIVFQIDNPPQLNGGYLRVGWNLDAAGKVTDGWGGWSPIEGWTSWEDQGGGLALASFGGGGRPSAVVLHVDGAPNGVNAGLFTVRPLAVDWDDRATLGLWRTTPYLSDVLPVHAAMLHTGKVLFFAGSGNNFVRSGSPDFGNAARGVYTSTVWDYRANTFAHPQPLRRPDGRPIDLFCCGHCFLPDGRLLVAGGTDKYDIDPKNGSNNFLGIADAMTFDPGTETWVTIYSMAGGRWYPTLVLLADGRALACSGRNDVDARPNDTLEVIADVDAGAWVKTRDFGLPYYPHLFQLRDGRLFFTGGKMDTDGDSAPFTFDPFQPTASDRVDGLREVGLRNQCASVILPPAQDQRVMILGGGPEAENDATFNVDVVDLSQPTPAYQPAARLNFNRMHVNAVLLPDRSVLAVGGGGLPEAGIKFNDFQAVQERRVPERFDPSLTAADKWVPLAIAQVRRLYHSVALLLPDGRVLSAGGNPVKGSQVDWLPPDAMEEMRLEIFSPPYLFASPRPVITAAPPTVAYDAAFTVATPQAAQVKWISLIRSGSTTHSFNGDQRLVDVPFVVTGSGLQATLTDERTVATPGWYMLFLTDNFNVPSLAHWLQVL